MKFVHVVVMSLASRTRQILTIVFDTTAAITVLDVINNMESTALYHLKAPSAITRALNGKAFAIDDVVLQEEEQETYIYWMCTSSGSIPLPNSASSVQDVTYFS